MYSAYIQVPVSGHAVVVKPIDCVDWDAVPARPTGAAPVSILHLDPQVQKKRTRAWRATSSALNICVRPLICDMLPTLPIKLPAC